MVLKLWLLPSYNIGRVKKIILCEVWRSGGVELGELWRKLQPIILDRRVFDENLNDLLYYGVSVRGFMGLAFRSLFKGERWYPLRREKVDGKDFIYRSDKFSEIDRWKIIIVMALLVVSIMLGYTYNSTLLIYTSIPLMVFIFSRLMWTSTVEVFDFNRVLRISLLRLKRLDGGFQAIKKGRCKPYSEFKAATTIREVVEKCLGEDSVESYEILYADTKPPFIKPLDMTTYLFEEDLPERSTLIAVPLDGRKILEEFTLWLKYWLTTPRTKPGDSKSKKSRSKAQVLKIAIPKFCEMYPMPLEVGLPLCLKTAREEGWTVKKRTIIRRLT